MRYVLDSSAIIEILQWTLIGEKIVKLYGSELLWTTSICLHEIEAGLISQKEKERWKQIYQKLSLLPHDEQGALQSAETYHQLKNKGKMINILDILTAGICKAHDGNLITLDKDFLNVKDLKVRVIT
ncbi:type II toxin-antitoxin system VapC family toxin [Candidatus Woesearchaeota archaeon]|nr:type II toxin-antitoxin system VapC family toxin [Candidatus Woesearchaeota archaeon]